MSLGEIDYSAIAMSQQTGSFEAGGRKPPTNLDSDTDDDLPRGQNQIAPDDKFNADAESKKRPLPSPQVDCLPTDAC